MSLRVVLPAGTRVRVVEGDDDGRLSEMTWTLTEPVIGEWRDPSLPAPEVSP